MGEPTEAVQGVDVVREALSALVAAIDAADVATLGVFTLAQIHGMPYRGPTYGVELEAARRALGEPKRNDQPHAFEPGAAFMAFCQHCGRPAGHPIHHANGDPAPPTPSPARGQGPRAPAAGRTRHDQGRGIHRGGVMDVKRVTMEDRVADWAANHFGALVLALVVIALGLMVLSARMEARVYTKLTGREVTTWEAMWVELRVDAP